jgi:tRNA C32,U32 (ribose-2'-O)-methylase TrmJ
LELRLFADGVENPANRARIADVADLLGAVCVSAPDGHLIAVENVNGAQSVYGRRALRQTATLAVGNERRGLSRAVLAAANETVAIPTLSRTVNTLNVAAAAAVAGWYVARGSGPQAVRPHPERRRPAVVISGDEHVEIGSSLRSAAAFGFREIHLDDRSGGWFAGDHHRRREARAAARRHKNPLRVRRASVELTSRFDEVVAVTPAGPGARLARETLTRGRRQLIVVGCLVDDVLRTSRVNVREASLGLEAVVEPPLRLIASIVLAEVARQVGQPATRPPARVSRGPRYDRELELVADGEMLLIEPEQLLAY